MYFGYVLVMTYNRVLFKKITGEELVNPVETKPGGFIAFRAGVIELLTTPEVQKRKLGVGFITSMTGGVDKAFDQVDIDRDGHIDKKEFRQVLSDMNFEPPEEEIDNFMNELDKDKNDRVRYNYVCLYFWLLIVIQTLIFTVCCTSITFSLIIFEEVDKK